MPAEPTDSRPLVNSSQKKNRPHKQSAPNPPPDSLEEEIDSEEQTDFRPVVNSTQIRNTPPKQPALNTLRDFDEEESASEAQTDADLPEVASHEDTLPEKETGQDFSGSPVKEEIPPVKPGNAPSLVNPFPEKPRFVRQVPSHAPTAPVRKDIPPVKQASSHFEQGLRFGFKEQYQKAVEELNKSVEEKPNNLLAQLSLGVACRRLNEIDRALSCYEAALKINPKFAEAHYFRANILYDLGNVREAMDSYTIAIGLRPELIDAHLKPRPDDRLTDYSPAPAEIYSIARPAHRILEISESLNANPRQVNLLKQRADAYTRLWNYERAIADYNSSLAIQPDDARTLHLRGLAYEQLGQSDRALKDFQQAATTSPQLSDVYLNRGIEFGRMGNFRQSIDSLTEGIRLAPNNPDGYFNRGTTYLQLGDFERAIEDFSRVIQLSTSDDAAYYWRGIANEQAGREPDAMADYRQFLMLSQDPEARGEVEYRLSQIDGSNLTIAHKISSFWKGLQRPSQEQSDQPVQALDLYSLLGVLGERAIRSTWFGNDVQCSGETAENLYAAIEDNRPVDGYDLHQIASGIHQIVAGDFQAFDPDAHAPWIFIRAWKGSGFYIETDDPKIKRRLMTRLRSVEEVEGAPPPYDGLFVPIPSQT
jgi:tetratricopeptide (TPR) repeat protein